MSFQAKTITFMVHRPVLAQRLSMDMISAVQLHSGKGCLHNKTYPRCAAPCPGCFPIAFLFFCKYKVMVISAAVFQLLIFFVYIFPYLFFFSEIKRGALHTHNFPGGNRIRCSRSIEIAVDFQKMVLDVTRIMTRKIKISVIGQINDCILIADGGIINMQCMVFCK